ncbi:hypothetical protein J2T16_001686 [Paenibacillus intestini]|uniref:DUF4365 domain-containing protein n=1 Tax=Paenibacillus cucumis (ex Kampfer et al. 2016) TaxID=1776858 RepID=A0ABS7KCC4_9BACL|nr:DUF4365 domain-containing protein [Paenibacillus cucumis (ex Kampfer et al. 2016)]MBY0201778.1 DUF4365 domain-containing protein [Paenibacillus cucumis (ex Kampfer et al. 2016)]MDP9698789.1 hypothetical protein [Paenibacillus intestini]
MIIESHIKEGLSRAYVIAVAHKAGMNFSKPDFDYGFDGTFRDTRNYNGRYCDTGFCIDIQLKATENVVMEEDYIKYDLEVKNYNDLVLKDVGSPRILVLYVLPPEQDEWLNVSEFGTTLKNCAWWCSLKGMEPTTNSSRVRIKVPKSQLLTEVSLKSLMNKVKMGEEICNLT